MSGSGAAVVGVGVVAYLIGLRHAFDPDHLMAIDNSARIAVGQGKPRATLGFFFSLGHGTVVFVVSVVAIAFVSLSAANVAGATESPSFSVLPDGTGIAGTISGCFLILVGLINALITLRIVRARRQEQRGPKSESRPRARGGLWPVLQRFVGTVPRPGRMYVVGLLFGLSLDTAASVSLLIVGGSSSQFSGMVELSVGLPILFLAGMSLGDTASGHLATRAYRWASNDTHRHEVVNLVLTGVSSTAALVLGVFILATADVVGQIALGIFATACVVSLSAAWHRRKRAENFPSHHRAESPPSRTNEPSGVATL
ncbi:HoxN/HupN/NixA family nickel/cobalt transporter [Salinibacterium sp. NYA9b]